MKKLLLLTTLLATWTVDSAYTHAYEDSKDRLEFMRSADSFSGTGGDVGTVVQRVIDEFRRLMGGGPFGRNREGDPTYNAAQAQQILQAMLHNALTQWAWRETYRQEVFSLSGPSVVGVSPDIQIDFGWSGTGYKGQLTIKVKCDCPKLIGGSL